MDLKILKALAIVVTVAVAGCLGTSKEPPAENSGSKTSPTPGSNPNLLNSTPPNGTNASKPYDVQKFEGTLDGVGVPSVGSINLPLGTNLGEIKVDRNGTYLRFEFKFNPSTPTVQGVLVQIVDFNTLDTTGQPKVLAEAHAKPGVTTLDLDSSLVGSAKSLGFRAFMDEGSAGLQQPYEARASLFEGKIPSNYTAFTSS